MRKIISISFNTTRGTIYALCDDGSLWERVRNPTTGQMNWIRHEDVPQEIHSGDGK